MVALMDATMKGSSSTVLKLLSDAVLPHDADALQGGWVFLRLGSQALAFFSHGVVLCEFATTFSVTKKRTLLAEKTLARSSLCEGQSLQF